MWKAQSWRLFQNFPKHPAATRYVRHMGADTEKFHQTPDTFSVSPVSKGRTHNKERPTMDINDLFDGIMKSINQFAEGRSRTSCASRHSNVPVHQIAEQRLQEKMQESGRGPENGVRPEGPGWPEGTAARLIRQDAKPGQRSAMRRILRRKRSGI
jgi:hypothetical protein